MPSKRTTKQKTPLTEAIGPTEQRHLVSITPVTFEQKLTMPAYSNSRLVAVNMCPTWGVVSAQKRYPTTARSMALEYGALLHEVFAAVRIWQLHRYQRLTQHAMLTANRLFGFPKSEQNYFDQKFDSNRFQRAWSKCATVKDDRESLMILSYEILHGGGWKDSPDDTTRTLDSAEVAAICYIDEVLKHMDNYTIYVENTDRPSGVIGIENVFDVVLTYDDGKQYRFIGTLDGLTFNVAKKKYTLEDNKTAARLDDGWKASFTLSHQISGYLACAASVYGFDIYDARILGLKNKPTNRGEDTFFVPTSRTAEQFARWAFWVRHTADMYEYYKDYYEYAPRYTHSCSRFFRPCSLVPFCGDTYEGRVEQWQQMVSAKMTPSELAAED